MVAIQEDRCWIILVYKVPHTESATELAGNFLSGMSHNEWLLLHQFQMCFVYIGKFMGNLRAVESTALAPRQYYAVIWAVYVNVVGEQMTCGPTLMGEFE